MIRLRGRRILQAAVLDRVQDQRGGRLNLVEVGTDLSHGIRGGERVADAAVLPEQLSSLLLRRRELDPADLTVGAVMVTGKEPEKFVDK